MRIISFILLVFIIGCGVSTDQDTNKDSILTDMSNDPAKYIIYDTVRKKYVIWDTVHKKFRIWDTLSIAIPIDSPYMVGRPVDSPYMVPRYVDTIIYRYSDSCVPTLPPPDTTTPGTTQYGLMQASDDKDDVKRAMQAAGINMIRLPLYFERTTVGQVIDAFLNDGFFVQIGFNWKSTSSPVLFPTDTAMIRSKAEAFFKYYLKWRAKIPFVSVENEWDNDHYRDWSKAKITDYITELKIVCEVGHKYGFKITDAGITGNTLGRWTYSQLSVDSALWWKDHYFVGVSATNYQPMLKLVSDYVRLIRFVPIDYLNTHWYNNNGRCSQGYAKAFDIYAKACGKETLPRINNEFGMRDGNMDIWKCTVKEMKQARIVYAIAYSGDGNLTPAQRLTHEYLIEMK